MSVVFQIVKLLGINAVFLAIGALGLYLLAKYKRAAYAVLKRNFVGYFSNPTGYVFLCLFVLLSSFAAFWPHEFFNSNLANLAQLNHYFPFVMLVFIPAITMSIWAEERRQGTDELLLTIPAGDFDIVIGKYLAAASIYTASLLFSEFSNFAVLNALALGDIDTGHFAATYAGYWLIGLAMLAVGMVASFLTSNLTVGFVLGAVFNAPLAFLAVSDVIIPSRGMAQLLSRWSYSSQFADFGRGVIGLASSTYFLMIVLVGLYLSMVLIGRRHWSGGRDGKSMFGHYLLRGVALVVIAIGANVFFSNHDWIRYDATSEKVSSLSPDTGRLLGELKPDHTVVIEAFLSASVPEEYVKTKLDLISMLQEFDKQAGGKIQVRIYDNLEPYSDEAARAEEQYGIESRLVIAEGRGQLKQEDVFLGAAFTCGLEKVVVPFFDVGIPVEYELIRSIATVANAERQKLGVLRTDAELYGGFDFQRMMPREKQAIIEELEKQYEVVQVDPNEPIVPGAYDVLLAVQPSSLTEAQLENLTSAIRNGQPTAIFEDPFPVALYTAPGTGQPRRPPGGGMMMGMNQPPPEPKGDIRKLWSLLGIEMVGQEGFGGGYDAYVVWQRFNPYPKVRGMRQISDEWVFVAPEAPGAEDPLNSHQPITSKLHQLLFLFPGAVQSVSSNGLKFTELVSTGDQTGTIRFDDLRDHQVNPGLLEFKRRPRFKRYVLAARIQGEVKEDVAMAGAGVMLAQNNAADATGPVSQEPQSDPSDRSDPSDQPDKDESQKDESQREPEKKKEIDVIFVTDIDLLHSDFLSLRARPDSEINWRFDNVTFVLNILDTLAGDDRFVEIRKRQTRYPSLKMVELATAEARQQASDSISKYEADFEKAREEAEQRLKKASQELQKEVDNLREKAQGEGQVSSKPLEAALTRLAVQQQLEQRRLDAETERLRREQNRNLKRIERERDLAVRNVQSRFKWWAVFLPFVPPLTLGVLVFFQRRSREREGITQERRR
jgi:ABC-2 type transport system permease protein